MKLLFTLSFCFFISFLTCFRGNYVFLGISNLVEIWWELKRRVRLCLVRVKALPENILFSEKENVFMCLAATKFVLRKINSGVWFIQTFLQKKQNLAKKFHTHSSNPHSFTEETKASKKIHQIRSNWDRAAEEKMGSCGRSEIGAIVRQEARSTIAIDEGRARRTIAPLVDRRLSLLPLSLSDLGSLSSLSLSLFFRKWFELKIRV